MKFAVAVAVALLSFVPIVVAAEPSNETASAQFSVTKWSLENTTDLSVAQPDISLNYYNYTIHNRSLSDDGVEHEDENENGKPSIVMRIQPPSTSKSNIEQPLPSTSTPTPRTNTGDAKLEWISKPLREGLSDFKVRSKSNSRCNLHSDLYKMHLRNQTLWAVRSK